MKAIKKQWPEKGEWVEPYYQAVLLGKLFGMYAAKMQVIRKQAQYFDEFDIPDTFDEALEFFKNKLVLDKKEFKRLDKEARRLAFSMAITEKETVLKRIKESLDAALASGQTLEEWRDEILTVFDQIGVTEVNPYYLETVFRTNTQEAYNRGKDAIYGQIDPEEFPLREFVTVEDDRVRPEHAALNGFRAPIDDPIWKKLKPPLSYNCRCTTVPVHRDEGLEPSDWRPSLTGRGFEFVS